MGTAIIESTSDIISQLSIRAVIGATIALLFLVILSNSFRKNPKLRQILFLLVIGVVICASSVLVTTTIVALKQQTLTEFTQ